MTIHMIFDILAWMSALSVRFLFRNSRYLPDTVVPPHLRFSYKITLMIGASIGALFYGSFNLMLQYPHALGHSILGGIIGGTAAVEIFKQRHPIEGSTGVVWVIPLALGIAVGRLGCFFAGLPDYTYGTPTTLPWGVDFGDGVMRHPVQLYESASMLAFAAAAFFLLTQKNLWFKENGFYLFTVVYACQRFAWEFLKPYAKILWQFNLFHILCLLLASYGMFMMTRKRVQ